MMKGFVIGTKRMNEVDIRCPYNIDSLFAGSEGCESLSFYKHICYDTSTHERSRRKRKGFMQTIYFCRIRKTQKNTSVFVAARDVIH